MLAWWKRLKWTAARAFKTQVDPSARANLQIWMCATLNCTLGWTYAGAYKPSRCSLCLAEKLCILTAQNASLLNKRSELVTKCRHENKFFMVTNQKKRQSDTEFQFQALPTVQQRPTMGKEKFNIKFRRHHGKLRRSGDLWTGWLLPFVAAKPNSWHWNRPITDDIVLILGRRFPHEGPPLSKAFKRRNL